MLEVNKLQMTNDVNAKINTHLNFLIRAITSVIAQHNFILILR